MVYIILGIIAGLGCGAGIYFILNYRDQSSTLPRLQFQREQAKIIQQLEEKKDAADKEFQKELEQRYKERVDELDSSYAERESKLQNQYNIKSREITTKLQSEIEHSEQLQKKLKDDYSAAEREFKEKSDKVAQERQQALQEQIIKEQTELNNKLSLIEKNYKDKENEMNESFFQFNEQINSRRAALSKEIEVYEAKQQEIIARFKADEEKKQQADFYRIKVSELEKQDIVKLKALSASFSKPEVLLKLIYEVYYKPRLEELFKRVLGENKLKGGIYKITNINNQKVYIGKTTNLLSRWRLHSKRGCGIERISGQLYDAMYNEGLEFFTWEIVEICSKEEQSEKEKYWIGFYSSNQYGYNQRIG